MTARDLAATVRDAEAALSNLEGAANGAAEWRAEYRQDIATVKQALAALERQATAAQAECTDAEPCDVCELARELAEERIAHTATEAARVRAEEALLTALAAFYSADYAECARVCDEVLDRSGALLVKVRALATAGSDTS